MALVMGLDIGGANTKVCLLQKNRENTIGTQAISIYHEVWNNPAGLQAVLENAKALLVKDQILEAVALTMTAELCDGFQSKSQGVMAILNMVENVFGRESVYIWTNHGFFVNSSQIRSEPLQAAAANWLASAVALAQSHLFGQETVLFLDMGSTTTDIIPLQKGKVLNAGITDTERLATGELVYTGTLRTSIASILDHVYLDGKWCRVANEYFAITADVYRMLEVIQQDDYDVPTPDGGPKDIAGCARRLARMVAADQGDLGMEKIRLLALYIKEKQTEQIMESIFQVISQSKAGLPEYLITTGQGSFLLEEVGRRLAKPTVPWWTMVPGAQSSKPMTAYAVAWLVAQQLETKWY